MWWNRRPVHMPPRIDPDPRRLRACSRCGRLCYPEQLCGGECCAPRVPEAEAEAGLRAAVEGALDSPDGREG